MKIRKRRHFLGYHGDKSSNPTWKKKNCHQIDKHQHPSEQFNHFQLGAALRKMLQEPGFKRSNKASFSPLMNPRSRSIFIISPDYTVRWSWTPNMTWSCDWGKNVTWSWPTVGWRKVFIPIMLDGVEIRLVGLLTLKNCNACCDEICARCRRDLARALRVCFVVENCQRRTCAPSRCCRWSQTVYPRFDQHQGTVSHRLRLLVMLAKVRRPCLHLHSHEQGSDSGDVRMTFCTGLLEFTGNHNDWRSQRDRLNLCCLLGHCKFLEGPINHVELIY